jgi:hypothetical protein
VVTWLAAIHLAVDRRDDLAISPRVSPMSLSARSLSARRSRIAALRCRLSRQRLKGAPMKHTAMRDGLVFLNPARSGEAIMGHFE